MRRFRQRFSGTILDVGGTLGTWRGRDADVTVVNVDPPEPWDTGSARFVRGDGRHLDFADSSFDVVYCNSVIEHVGSPARSGASAEATGSRLPPSRSRWSRTS
jgi:2-polyprenyl-3-methyl-5-hydroxy-6-metoxy-1,4-benzoquinol methylase